VLKDSKGKGKRYVHLI